MAFNSNFLLITVHTIIHSLQRQYLVSVKLLTIDNGFLLTNC
nr:MAG TPA: hypothetical protein [Caudoviricetes sp.]